MLTILSFSSKIHRLISIEISHWVHMAQIFTTKMLLVVFQPDQIAKINIIRVRFLSEFKQRKYNISFTIITPKTGCSRRIAAQLKTCAAPIHVSIVCQYLGWNLERYLIMRNLSWVNRPDGAHYSPVSSLIFINFHLSWWGRVVHCNYFRLFS